MSLFDDNFMIALEAKAEKADKEEKDTDKDEKPASEEPAPAADDATPADDAPADDSGKEDKDSKEEDKKDASECAKEDNDGTKSGTDPEEKEEEEVPPTPEEEAAIELAVDADIEAESLAESVGFDTLVASDIEDAQYACLEAVTALTAFDQADLACTEAYVAAGSQFEKDIVTESFKDSAKKFGARIKSFILKIKDAIARIFNKAVNYLKVLGSRINAKFASRIKLDSSKQAPVNAKVKAYAALDGSFDSVIKAADSVASADVLAIMSSISGGDVAQLKQDLANLKVPGKSDIVKAVLKGEAAEVELRGKYDKEGNNLLNDLKTISKNVTAIKNWRSDAESALKKFEQQVRGSSDINTDELNLLSACVSKAVSIFNVKVSALFTLQSAWINQRVRIIRALAKYQGKDVPEAPKVEVEKNSASFIGDFFAMIG